MTRRNDAEGGGRPSRPMAVRRNASVAPDASRPRRARAAAFRLPSFRLPSFRPSSFRLPSFRLPGLRSFPFPFPSVRRFARRPASPRRLRPIGYAVAGLAVVLLALVGLGARRDVPAAALAIATSGPPAATSETARLERQLAALAPRGVYVTVDAVENRLQVKRGDAVLRDASCSAGTGSVLEDPKTGRRWVFDTPRGARTVLEKRKDPVWTKPEWAFIEEGEAPPKRWSDRIDAATLGDYALYLGDGYMIHGTLYQRYLGRNVTHGCVRLGDDDLEFVYRNVPVGASVFLY